MLSAAAIEKVRALTHAGHLPAALATAHARQVLLGGSVEGAKFESEAKRRGRISSSLKGSTEHRGSPQPMYAEEMFRPQSSSGTAQGWERGRSLTGLLRQPCAVCAC